MDSKNIYHAAIDQSVKKQTQHGFGRTVSHMQDFETTFLEYTSKGTLPPKPITVFSLVEDSEHWLFHSRMLVIKLN